MSSLKHGRYFVVLIMTAVFLYNVGKSVLKYTDGNIGETQSTKLAAEMFFPSVHICPYFDANYSLARMTGTKNMTEYYESCPRIKDLLLSIEQSYEAENGLELSVYSIGIYFFKTNSYLRTEYLQLNGSYYDAFPNMVDVKVQPDNSLIAMRLALAPHNLLECVTINPLGPTKPGLSFSVR